MSASISCAVILTLTVTLLMASVTMLAHHGTNISFDQSTTITLEGVVTEFRFSNPHTQLYFDVKDEHGNVVNWGAELSSPASLISEGWSKQRVEREVAPGTPITAILYPGRSGNPVGLVSRITNAAGETILPTRAARRRD